MQVYNTYTQFTPGYTRRGRSVYTMSMSDSQQVAKTVIDEPLPEFVEQVEKDLLSHIYTYLKDNQLTGEDGQKLAQEFLKELPFQDKKDLLEKLNKLGKVYKPAQEVYVKYVVPYEEAERQRKLSLMHEHIVKGNIEAALAVAKGNAGQNPQQEVAKGGQNG